MNNSSLALKPVRHIEIELSSGFESRVFLHQEIHMRTYQKHLEKKVFHEQIKLHLTISWSFLVPKVLLEKFSKICLISWSENIFQMSVYPCHG